MKRNMVPFMGIAFVVAIICTGVWYGLLAGKLRSSNELPGHAVVVAARDLDPGTVIQPSDLRVSEIPATLTGSFSKREDAAGSTLLVSMKANEPLLEERVTPRVSDAMGTGGGVPVGMRAVTIHVFQSESLLNVLRPGSRVDLQAVSDRNGGTELRTVLENVQVLAVSAPDSNGNRPAGAAVTILIRSEDADPVALADSGSRIRVTLRNPADEEKAPHRSLALAALFSAGSLPSAGRAEPGHTSNALWDHPIQLRVWVLSVTDSALLELGGHSHELKSDGAWRLASVESADEVQDLIRGLEKKDESSVVTSERLTAGLGRPISYHAGARAGELRVQFEPEWAASHQLSLRVKTHLEGANGPETVLPGASAFLLESQAAGEKWAERIFPGRSWERRHVVIFVVPRVLPQASAVAVAGRSGRR